MENEEKIYSRGLEVLSELMPQFPGRVYGEYSGNWDPDCPVGVGVLRFKVFWWDFIWTNDLSYIWPVSVASKKGIFSIEQRLNILQASNFEFLRVSVNDLPFEGVDERIRIEEERPVRKTDVTLLQWLEIVFGDRGLADGAGTEVDDLVAIVPDLGVEMSHTWLSPVPPNDRQQVTQHIRLGDRPVNVGNNHLGLNFYRYPTFEMD